MNVFITGASGFIGKRLVAKLLRATGHRRLRLIARRHSRKSSLLLREAWGDGDARVNVVAGDITEPELGVAAKDARRLKGKIDHFFHLAAVYDLAADPAEVAAANVGGVRNALDFAKAMRVAPLPSCQFDRGGGPL